QDIGTLYREIAELRRAGAFMDNVRQRGMVGFVTNPIGDAIADRAVGGGFTAGTQTEMTLTKTQKALIEAKAEKLYREGLRLQERMLELTREWQEVLVEAAQAQWELKMARAASASAPTQSLRLEGAAWEAQALARLNSAVIRYNMLSGRSPSEPLPFEGLDAADMEAVLAEIRGLMASPERMRELLQGLGPEALAAQVGEDPFNIADWLPWVDRLTLSVGVQFQDLLANQIFGVGGSVRLPCSGCGRAAKEAESLCVPVKLNG
ncbi:MAG: hypothetical protein AAB576_12305, partial [Elusimicrobiota bacterium]